MDSNSKAMQWLRVAVFAGIAGIILACAALSFYVTVVISESNPPPYAPVDATYPSPTNYCVR